MVKVERCCGNCLYHSAYRYPTHIFCFERFVRRENPVMPTLSCCELWEPDPQDCFCVRDALKEAAEEGKERTLSADVPSKEGEGHG